MYGDDAYRALAEEPDSEQYVYSNYAYSGGGIGPAIVGTCLLVVGSISIALTLGILCAIFLSEYSTPGRTLQLIRLSSSTSPACPRSSLDCSDSACSCYSLIGASH